MQGLSFLSLPDEFLNLYPMSCGGCRDNGVIVVDIANEIHLIIFRQEYDIKT